MIYLDNAATTLYKPPEVGHAMLDALQTAGNPGRGAHAPTLHASRIVYETREALAQLFHAEGPACIASTASLARGIMSSPRSVSTIPSCGPSTASKDRGLR